MNAFDFFLKRNGYTNEIIKNSKLLEVEYDKKRKKWIFIIEFSNFVDADLLFSFTKAIKDHFKDDLAHEIDVKIKHLKTDKFEEYALNYWVSTISHLGRKKASNSALREIKVDFKDNTFLMRVSKLSIWVKDVIPEIYEIFKDISIDAKVDYIIDDSLDEARKKYPDNITRNTLRYDDKNIVSRKISGNRKAKKVMIKDIPIDGSKIEEYIINNGNALFKIEGKINSIEIKELTTATLLEAIIEDDSDAITIKSFINNEKDKDFAKSLTPLMYVELTGEARFDTFAADVVLMVEGKIEVNPKPEFIIRKDLEKEKRIELHLHTKMSEMDGICDVSEFVKRALYWGHDAIAFTDHNSLQAFPDIVKETNGKPIKPIFGVELDMVDPEKFIVVEKVDENEDLLDSTYVVFDIETTGLSVINDYIIEIGAVKIKNGEIIDRYQSFVNPEINLSNFIKDLTNINDDDLKDARLIENVLPEFINFIKDSILVAHNAQFDITFIRQKAFEIGFEINNNYIDTLNLARYFYNDKLKRFNLKALSRYFKVELENHHRADVDAEATSKVWLKMLYDLREKRIKTSLDLYNAINMNESYKYMFPTHVTILAKNQVGYKNLFKLVSLALTKNFYQNPRILKSDISALKEGLLIGSACGKGDVFELALNGRTCDLIKAISFYDYIEINPPSYYFYLIEKRSLDNQYLIESVIKKIISEAKKQKKLVVATGDVHYLEKEDLIYRKIYIRTPVVGGGIHPLYGVENIPDQYFRSTTEMLAEFNFLGEEIAKEIVVTNTHLINKKIEKIKAFPDKLYSLDDDAFNFMGISSIEAETKKIVLENATKKYGKNLHFIVKNRIEKELESIIGNKFAPIYYISHLLVKKSLNDGYLVGSRGSVGSSLVATLMDITEVNPLKPHYRCANGDFTAFKLSDDEIFSRGISENEKAFQKNFENIKAGYDLPDAICPICGKHLIKDGHDIPFETFLGFKGDKVPDIDLNFSGEYQAQAHNYVKDLLGEDYSYRAGTVSTVADKTAYGYVLGYLEDNNETARRAKIKILANKIKGVKRSTGQHPGGIIVVPKNKSIYDVTPIQYPANDTTSKWYTTHFDYHSFESNLLKLDILGHDDPTMIKFLMDYVKEKSEEFTFKDAVDIPLDDIANNIHKYYLNYQIVNYELLQYIIFTLINQKNPDVICVRKSIIYLCCQ